MASESLANIVEAAVTFGLAPAFVLFVGWLLNQKNNKRAEEVKTVAAEVKDAVEQHSLSSSADSTVVVEAVKYLRDDLRDFRAEFKDYRKDHAREHQLINDKILRP